MKASSRTHHSDPDSSRTKKSEPKGGLAVNRLLRPEDPVSAVGNQTMQRLGAFAKLHAVQADLPVPPNSSGQPLDKQTRGVMESRFGEDFSAVRIHSGATAKESAAALDAKAFTLGHDIYFGAGLYDVATKRGQQLLAHELTHTIQQSGIDGSAACASVPISVPSDPQELEAERVSEAVTRGESAAVALSSDATVQRQTGGDPDHPPSPPTTPQPDVNFAPLEDWTPQVDIWDQDEFWTPPGTTRERIAQRLYHDPNHFGGFDIIGEQHVRLRSFDGVDTDVVAIMRAALDARLATDVNTVVEILKQRRINDADEWRLLNITIWWSSKGDLKNAKDRSYFDAYLELLDTHTLREWGLFSDTVKPASEWLIVEAEEKKWPIYPLIARRSSRGATVELPGGDTTSDFGRVTGPITDAPRPFHDVPNVVGGYSYHSGEDRFGIEEEAHGIGSIQVGRMIVDETTGTRAEIALRNSQERGARVMIPGGNGHFYGYTISWPHFWDEGYVQPTEPAAQRLENFWWHYPGTVFISGGSYQAEFGRGGESESRQRAEILTSAIQAGLGSLRGLDFDVLSLMTMDQRVSAIGLAASSNQSADAGLIVRILYATPAAEFTALEHRLSTNGTMTRLMNTYSPGGDLAAIGRIFTVKSLQAGPVPGETLENLTEFTVGFDEQGHYHYAMAMDVGQVASNLVPGVSLPPGTAPAIGREAAGSGETPGPINRTATKLQQWVFRVESGVIGSVQNFWRGMAETLMVAEGPPQGPWLPTQLVRVRTAGPNPQTRIVTVLEAIGLLQLPGPELLKRMISAHIQGGMVVMAGMGLVRAFGPAIAEALVEGGGARAAAASVADVAASQAGRSALVNAGLITAISVVDSYREQLAKTEAGRAFLEIYDVAMVVWIANDAARLISTGLIPRLVAAADRVMALPQAFRDAVMPLRAEAEAMRRAIARYATPAEAAAAASIDASAIAAPSETRPGFMAMLRVARGEVAAERFMGQVAGTPLEAAGKRVFGRLQGLVSSSEAEAAGLVGPDIQGPRAAAERQAESAARAQFAVATRASQLRPDAREAFLNAVDRVVSARPNSLATLTDLLTAAAESRTPNLFIGEVQKLVSRPGVSADTLRVLGAKARSGGLDLAWLNRTSITDETLEFLGRDPQTKWDLFRRAAADPTVSDVMRQFRISARGAGAEMVAAGEAENLGTNVRRQVNMGSSEIDYEVTIAGRRHGFEVKGWTADTWEEALDAAIQRLNRKGLSEGQSAAVEKIDRMIRQLQDAKAATGRNPYLGLTDALKDSQQQRLRRVLSANGLGGTQFVDLPEGQIREAAQGAIGEALGVPRP